MRIRRLKWLLMFTTASGLTLQLYGCENFWADSLVRLAQSVVFVPLNDLLTTYFATV